MQGHSSISNFKLIGLIAKTALFLTIVYIIFSSAGRSYSLAAEENTINAFTSQRMDEFYDQPKNNIDTVFIGSSHCYCTFDPQIIDGYLHTNSWQLGTPSQHPDTSYYLLREVFNYQRPKTVVMELYWDVMDDEFEPKQADSLFEVLRNEKLKEEYISQVFPTGDKVKYAIPAIRYQQEYFAYKAKDMEKEIEEKYDLTKNEAEKDNGVEYYQGKGYVYCDTTMSKSEYDKTNQFKYFNGSNWDFNSTQKKYLEKIIDLCKSQGTELIFVTAPVANVSMDFIQNYSKVNQKVSEFAQKNQVAYIDYNIINKEENLLTNENFRDDAHLNDSGVKIVDNHFAQWLKSNVD
ncbi:MAG TPA: hypothetical protein DIC60_10580 [Lachnospiraceae bacterium]|nr:hypothetical protein [Lachnospiraceae bacterium]